MKGWSGVTHEWGSGSPHVPLRPGVPVSFVLSSATLGDVIDYCRGEHPREACGLLVARDGDGPTRFVPVVNNHREPLHHWRMDDQSYGDALRTAQERGERLIGIVHSHPAGPPQLSAQDTAAALDPTVHYVLVSFDEGLTEVTVTSWRVVGGQAFAEGMVIR